MGIPSKKCGVSDPMIKNSLHFLFFLQADAFAKELGYAVQLRAGLVKLQVTLFGQSLRCKIFNSSPVPFTDFELGKRLGI